MVKIEKEEYTKNFFNGKFVQITDKKLSIKVTPLEKSDNKQPLCLQIS